MRKLKNDEIQTSEKGQQRGQHSTCVSFNISDMITCHMSPPQRAGSSLPKSTCPCLCSSLRRTPSIRHHSRINPNWNSNSRTILLSKNRTM
eukprot:scaffold29067_cov45-Cyclotella_meneghiniana.AAC.2